MAKGVAQGALGNLPRDGLSRSLGLARSRGDERTEAAAHLDDAVLDERPVGVLDRIGIQLQLVRQLPRRRQRLARFQDADGDRPLHLIGDLSVDRTRVVRC